VGITPAGAIVGLYVDPNSMVHGFLRVRNGTFTTFDVPGAVNYTSAYGINSAGQIVGSFYDGTTSHGFLTEGAAFTTFDVPGARVTEARGINPTGQIVGLFLDARGAHGFVATPKR